MIDKERLLEEKIIQELRNHRGVRIGESTVLSTKVHVFDPKIKGLGIIKNKDIGKTIYGENKLGKVMHMDVFHSQGQLSHEKLLQKLYKYFSEEETLLIETATGGDFLNDNCFQRGYVDRRALTHHIHLAIKIPWDKINGLLKIVETIEQYILENGLGLKKIEKIKGRYQWGRNPFRSPPKDPLHLGEGTPTRLGVLRGICQGVADERQVYHETLKKPHKEEKHPEALRKIIKELMENSGLEREGKGQEWETNRKYVAKGLLEEGIGPLAFTETIVNLIHKGYWRDSNTPLELQDIIFEKKWHKKNKNTILVLDNSFSVDKHAFNVLKIGLEELCDQIKGEVALILFQQRKAKLLTGFTGNKSRLKSLIRKIPLGGMTPLAHGLQEACDYGTKSLRKQINILLITDGMANIPLYTDCPITDCIEVAKKIKLKGFQLNCISIEKDTIALQEIAKAAGGKVYPIKKHEFNR